MASAPTQTRTPTDEGDLQRLGWLRPQPRSVRVTKSRDARGAVGVDVAAAELYQLRSQDGGRQHRRKRTEYCVGYAVWSKEPRNQRTAIATTQMNRARIGTKAIDASRMIATTMPKSVARLLSIPRLRPSRLRLATVNAVASMPATDTRANPHVVPEA